jgi:hypothetical protein
VALWKKVLARISCFIESHNSLTNEEKMKISRSQRTIANLLLVQGVWFVCVFGGTTWAWVATTVYFCIYQWQIGRLQVEWPCWVSIWLIGLLVDFTISWLGFMQFGREQDPLWLFLPGWWVALWLSFATLFLHGLEWLRYRPWLAAICGCIAGPLTYYSGAMMAGVTLAITTEKFLLCMAVFWAIMTPLFGAICASYHKEKVSV